MARSSSASGISGGPDNFTVDTFSEVDQREITSNILCEFLEVAFHHILYIRGIYPATLLTALFERRRKYDIPVYMSLHPELNQYILDVLMGIKPTLNKEKVKKIVLSIRNKDNLPVEQFVFSLQGLNERALREDPHLLQLERDLRALLLKISTSDAMLSPLPPDCTFVILVHTTDSAAASMEVQNTITEFPWVKVDGQHVYEFPDAKVTPLKTVTSSILKLQLYVDEKPNKE